MKKLLAILALVVLCGSYVFAAQTISATNSPSTGTYSANIFCTPILTLLNSPTNVDMGNYFQDFGPAAPTTATPMNWTLKGEPTAIYTIAVDGPTPVLGNGPGATLIGVWSDVGNPLDGTHSTANLNTTPPNPAYTQNMVGWFDCTNAMTFTFTPTSLQLVGATPGAQYQWTCTVTVSATI